MTISMTGYGRSARKMQDGRLEVEIRTVNNRYFDAQIRLPATLHFIEPEIRRRLQTSLHRGRIECTLTVHSERVLPKPVLREAVLRELLTRAQAVACEAGWPLTSGLGDFLRVDGVVEWQSPVFDESALRTEVLAAVEEAVQSLLAMRRKEGGRLAEDLRQKLDRMEENLEEIRQRGPQWARETFVRMEARVQELLQEQPVDADRLATEMALYAQKADIDEEVVRLAGHLVAFREKLEEEGPVGKSLDFLIQEMNREVNTMSSKSHDRVLTEHCIAQKTWIEQLREQIQNIE